MANETKPLFPGQEAERMAIRDFFFSRLKSAKTDSDLSYNPIACSQ